jgi:hypothetical protein
VSACRGGCCSPAPPPVAVRFPAPGPDPHLAWARQKALRHAEMGALDAGNDPTEELAERAFDEWYRLRKLIDKTPARTLAGATEQVRSAVEVFDLGCIPDVEDLRLALATLDRLAGRTPSA